MNHSHACDSFAAVHVQKLWQLLGVNSWSLLMFLWFSGVGSHWGHDLVCLLDHNQVQYSALSLNYTLKYWLSISWLWAFFLPKVLLHATAPPSHLWTSSVQHEEEQMKWHHKNYNNACHCSWEIMLNGTSLPYVLSVGIGKPMCVHLQFSVTKCSS
jgi:hypothetical protein